MFVDDIINGLKTEYANNESINATITVEKGYLYGRKRQKHHIFVTTVEDNTYANTETFFGETVRTMPVQITICSGQLRIDNELHNAQDSVDFLYEIAREFMRKFMLTNGEIKTCRRINSSTTLPLEESGADSYYKVIRYNINAQPN